MNIRLFKTAVSKRAVLAVLAFMVIGLLNNVAAPTPVTIQYPSSLKYNHATTSLAKCNFNFIIQDQQTPPNPMKNIAVAVGETNVSGTSETVTDGTGTVLVSGTTNIGANSGTAFNGTTDGTGSFPDVCGPLPPAMVSGETIAKNTGSCTWAVQNNPNKTYTDVQYGGTDYTATSTHVFTPFGPQAQSYTVRVDYLGSVGLVSLYQWSESGITPP